MSSPHVRVALGTLALFASAGCSEQPIAPIAPLRPTAAERTSSIATISTTYYMLDYYQVPAGVYSLSIVAVGGGGGGSDFDPGGSGAMVTSTLSVTPGQVLELLFGDGGTGSIRDHVGGGGGSTTITSPQPADVGILVGPTLVIAGGGGGAGGAAAFGFHGDGGSAGGVPGGGGGNGNYSSPGYGGRNGIGGAGGTGSGGSDGLRGGDGNGGDGGNGDYGGAGGRGYSGTGVGGLARSYGGGGGGGYGGGGGGAYGSGGGGGGSFGPAGTTYAPANNGGTANRSGGAGFIRITYNAAPAVPTVFMSGNQVDTWDAIPELVQPADFVSAYCTMTPKVGLSANWVNPHKAFVLTGHPWATDYFTAPWINAWNDLASTGSGSPGPGNYNWTKYHTMVEGTGTFVVRLLADNCSWIYLDDRLVGVQGGDLSKNSYGLTLNGTHSLDFIIFDGGGAAGGKYILETTTNPPPPLVVDATPPVITHAITGTTGTGGWYTSPVTVTWTATDPESPITSLSCAPQTISANTAAAGVVVTCSATSAGGTSTDPVTIKLDQSVPTVVATVPAPTGANGWYTSNIPVAWTVSGAGPSGIVTTCPSTVVSTEITGTTLSCTATTGAGLSATGATPSLKLDKTPPVLTGIPSGVLGDNLWYRSNVTVTWSATDNISGVATQCAANTLSVDNEGTTFTCIATNGAGLSSTLGVTVKRDATPPSLWYTGNAGTYTVDQTVAISCAASDAMSGLATNTCANINGAAYSFTLGANTYSANATDKAGNGSSAITTFTVRVTAGSLCALVERFTSNQGVAHSLCVKLDHGSWEPFRNELSAQTGKMISDTNAAILLRLVNALAAQ